MKTGIQLITEERHRQINAEGFSPKHDDEHTSGEMALAAAAYAEQAATRGWLVYDPGMIGIPANEGPAHYQCDEPQDRWPHEDGWLTWWKPKSPIEDLIRAGALCAAEIDRLQRLQNSKTEILPL